jgi:hypothetical protein
MSTGLDEVAAALHCAAPAFGIVIAGSVVWGYYQYRVYLANQANAVSELPIRPDSPTKRRPGRTNSPR